MDRSLVPDSPTSEASCNSTQQSSNDSRNNRECNDLFWGSTNKRPSLRSKFSKQKYWKLSAEQREMYNKHLVSQCFPGFPKVIYGLRMESEIAELGNQDEPNKIKVENGQGNLDVINNSPRNETIPEIPVTNSTENTKATLPSPYHEAVPSQTVHLNRYTSETNITNSIPQSSLVEQNTPQSQLSIMFEQTATLCGRVEAIEQQLAKLEKLGYFTPENLYDYSTSNLNNNTKEYFVGGKIISTVDSGNIEQNAMSNRELNSETEHDQNKIVNVIDKHLSEDFAKNSLSSNESLRIDPESKLLSNPGKAGVSECEKHDCLSKGLELYENNSDENVQHGCTEPSQIGNSSQTQNILTFNSATDLTSFLYNSDKKFHTKEAKGIHHACDWILANKQPRITSQIRVCSTLSYNTWWCRLTGSENVILPVIYRLTKEEWVCNIPANATERCVVVAETVNKHQSNIKLLQYSAATSESQSMYQINAIESQLVVLLKYNLGKDWHVTVVLRSVPYASNISEELEKMTGTPDSQQCESTFVQIIKLCSMNGTSDNQFDILFETGTNHQPILQTFDLDIVKEETILNDTNYEVLSEILNYKGEKIKKQHEKKEERQSNTKLVYFDGIELITQNLLGTTLKDSGEENAIHSKKILKQNCELFSAEFNKISYSESEFSEHIVRLLSINRQVENQEIYPQAEITRKHISENTSARKESTPESSSKEVQTQGDSKSNSLNVCKINLPPLLDPSSPEENVDRRFLLDNGCTYKRGHVFESAKSTDTSIDSTGKSTEASIDSTRSSLCKQDNSLLHSEVVTSPNVCSDENGTTILPENVQSVETCKKSSDVKLSNQIEEKFGVRAEYNLLINSNRKEKENKVKTTKTSITTLEKPSEYTRVNQALYSQRYGDNISLSLPTESFTQANESQTAKGEFHSKAETSSVKSDWISAIDNLEPIYSASTDNSKSDNTSKKQENFTLETVAPVSSCANSDTVTKVHTDVSRSGSNERPGVLQEKMESFSENNFSEEISTLTRGNKMNSGEKEICKVSPVPKYGLSPTKAEPEIMETNEPDQLNKNVFENFETDLECKDSSVKKESSKSKTEEVELIPSDKTNKNASFQESKIICSEKKVLVDSNNTKERSKTTEIKETAINVDDSYEQHATLKLTNVSFNEISNRKDRNVSSKHPNIENSTRIVHSVPKLEEISNANKTDESQCKEIKITESIKRTTKYFKEENICTGISNLQANDTNMSFKSTTSGMTKTISKADVSYGQISNSKESPQVPSVTSGSERTKLDEKPVQSTQNDVIVSPSIRDTIKPQNSQQKELENVNQSLQNIQIKKSDILVKNPEISNIHDNKGDITRKELDSATSGVQDYQIHSAQTIKEAKIESRKDERFQRSCKEIMSTVNDGIYEIALEGPIIEEKANQNIVHTKTKQLSFTEYMSERKILGNKKTSGQQENKMSLTSPTEKLNSKPVEDPISNINELQIRQQQVSGVLTSPQQNVPDSLKNNSKKSEDCKLSSPSASGTSASPYIGNDNLARKEVKNTESCLKTGTILKPQIDTVNRSMSDERKYVSTTETFKQISSKSSNDTGDKKTSMICPKSENTSPEIKPTITSPTNIKQLPTASQGTKCIQEEKKMSPTSNEAFSVDSSSLVTKQLSFTEYISERKILGNKKTSGQEENKMSLKSSENANSKPIQDPISNINELQKRQQQVSGVLTSPQQNVPDSLKNHSKKSEDGKLSSPSASGTSASPYIGNDNLSRKEVKNTESCLKTGTILKPQIDTVSRSMSDERKYVSTTETFKQISSKDTGDKKPSMICPKSVNTSPEIKPTITTTNVKQLPTASQGTRSTSTDLSQKSEKQLKKTSTCETNKSSSSVKEKPDTSKLPQLGKLSDGNVKSTSLVKENKQGNDKRSQSNATQNDSVIPIKAEQASSTNKNSKQIVSSQTNKVSTSDVKVSSKVVADKQVVPPKENSPKFKTESKVPKKMLNLYS
ncbi:hypothetical protein C0J52_08503 [Blattella germanica]|nr:hypothetical protein C0J52_08503 [Blattella germanica]